MSSQGSQARHRVGLLDLATRLPAMAPDLPGIVIGAVKGLTLSPTAKSSIGKVFADRAARHGNRVFLKFDDERLTYRQANETVNRYAAALAALGSREPASA